MSRRLLSRKWAAPTRASMAQSKSDSSLSQDYPARRHFDSDADGRRSTHFLARHPHTRQVYGLPDRLFCKIQRAGNGLSPGGTCSLPPMTTPRCGQNASLRIKLHLAHWRNTDDESIVRSDKIPQRNGLLLLPRPANSPLCSFDSMLNAGLRHAKSDDFRLG